MLCSQLPGIKDLNLNPTWEPVQGLGNLTGTVDGAIFLATFRASWREKSRKVDTFPKSRTCAVPTTLAVAPTTLVRVVDAIIIIIIIIAFLFITHVNLEWCEKVGATAREAGHLPEWSAPRTGSRGDRGHGSDAKEQVTRHIYRGHDSDGVHAERRAVGEAGLVLEGEEECSTLFQSLANVPTQNGMARMPWS